MKFLYFIVFPLTIVIPTILLYLTNRSYKKEIFMKCSSIYGLQLDTIRIRYEHIKKDFDFSKFPMIESNILKMISLQKNCYIDMKNLKMKRYRIFKLHELLNSFKLMDEVEKCDDEHVLYLLVEVSEINKKISKVRFPFKVKINKLFINIQIFLLYIAVTVLKKYKDITKDDVTQVENNNDFKDGTMSSGLTYQ